MAAISTVPAVRASRQAESTSEPSPSLEEESSPRVRPDRHAADRLAGHPFHVTPQPDLVQPPVPIERYRHRRDQTARELARRDRHEPFTTPYPIDTPAPPDGIRTAHARPTTYYSPSPPRCNDLPPPSLKGGGGLLRV